MARPQRNQIVRHVEVDADQFIGFEGELSYVIDNPQLRLHDGATAGGVKLLRETINDGKYQAKSVALDSLVAQSAGWVVRADANNFTPRSLVEGTNINITNANGVDGDPVISTQATVSFTDLFVTNPISAPNQPHFICVFQAGDPPVLVKSYNIANLERTGVGVYRITLTNDLSNTEPMIQATCRRDVTDRTLSAEIQSDCTQTFLIVVSVHESTGVPTDNVHRVHVMGIDMP